MALTEWNSLPLQQDDFPLALFLGVSNLITSAFPAEEDFRKLQSFTVLR